MLVTGGVLVVAGGCSESAPQQNPIVPAANTNAAGPVTTGGGVSSTGATVGAVTTSAAVTGGDMVTAGSTDFGATSAGTTGFVGGTNTTGAAVTGAATATVGGVTSTGTVAGVQTSGGGSSSMTSGATSTTSSANCTLEEERFSFFLTSQAALIRESGNPDGFGGNLGGITGADQICQTIAETSTPCAAAKTWRAFLSTTTEDAIDRIGSGPWYDRLGRLLANNTSEMVTDGTQDVRTLASADPAIRDDLPNEDGILNHSPNGSEVDNHQTLTGTGMNGRLYTQESGGTSFGGTACMDGDWTPEKATCWDWTTSDPVGCPRVGHSWPRDISGINWISVWNEGGCAPGGTTLDTGGPDGSPTVGSAGGYGGFYCFAVTGQ